MSDPFGDAATCSVLNALKIGVDGGRVENNLDKSFQQVYTMLRLGYLNAGLNSPSPRAYSQLSNLDGLIVVNGLIQVTRAAFDCELFHRSDYWFQTTERIVQLGHPGKNLGQCLAMYLCGRSSQEMGREQSEFLGRDGRVQKGLGAFVAHLGTHCEILWSVELVEVKAKGASNNNSTVETTDDGILFVEL